MNKKKIIYLTIIITLICIFQIMLLSSGRNAFDYIFRAIRGEYTTYIHVADKEEKRTKTVYCNGTYYIYSEEKKAICKYDTGEKIIPVPQKPEWMTAKGNDIFYSIDNILYQCTCNGVPVASHSFSQDERIFKICAEDENVYCSICTGDSSIVDTVYIFNAQDISKAGDIGKAGVPFDDIPGFRIWSEKFMQEYRIRQLKSGWIVASGEPDTIQIDYSNAAVKIQTKDTNKELIEFVGKSGREPVSERYNVLCIDGNALYAVPEGSECMVAVNGQNSIIGYSDDEFQYSYSVVDDRYLVILLEKYFSGFGGDGRPDSEGSVGGYFGGQLLMVNLDDRRLEKSVMMEEQVIYMDKDRYATLREGRIKIYRISDGKTIKEKKVKGYKMGKEYNMERCYDRLFVFCGDELLDTLTLD